MASLPIGSGTRSRPGSFASALRWRLLPPLVALALAAVPAVASAGPAISCADDASEYAYWDSSPSQIEAPWSAPTRNGNPTDAVVYMPEVGERRLGYELTIADLETGEIVATSTHLTPLGRERFGMTAVFPRDDVRSYRAVLRETWRPDGVLCHTEVVQDFMAGGALPRGPKPPLRVQATLHEDGRQLKALRGTVGRDWGFRPEVRLKVTTRCLVIDDGAGNGILAPRDVWVSMPRQVGGKRSFWEPCGSGPSTKPIGSSWARTKTFKGDFRVRAHSNGRRVSRWEVGFTSWKTHRTGRLEVTHRRYQRATARRVYSSDFDDYWNICVKGPREVWASGGRVYCVIQTRPESSVATVRLRG